MPRGISGISMRTPPATIIATDTSKPTIIKNRASMPFAALISFAVIFLISISYLL
jgi:hypothetical protein